MGRLAGFSTRDIQRAIERAGWKLVRTEGDHLVYQREGSRWNLVIPLRKDVSEGLLRDLVKKMGLSVDEFLALARK